MDPSDDNLSSSTKNLKFTTSRSLYPAMSLSIALNPWPRIYKCNGWDLPRGVYPSWGTNGSRNKTRPSTTAQPTGKESPLRRMVTVTNGPMRTRYETHWRTSEWHLGGCRNDIGYSAYENNHGARRHRPYARIDPYGASWPRKIAANSKKSFEPGSNQ
jgi:hypothetical protein